MTASAPEWFQKAIATPATSHSVAVEGCEIRYLRWGDPTLPGLVLVHGGAAHAHWWSFLAPLLVQHYSVVALDLSGHGDSGRREVYPRTMWADEVMAVARHADFVGPPILVGHSMGGLVSIVAAALHGDSLAGAIIVDAPVRKPDPESQEGERGRSFRNPKTYPDVAAARSHFRLIPPQPCENDFILDYISEKSLKAVPGGVTWKFDPVVFVRASKNDMHEHLQNVRCRIALLRGEHSYVVPPETGEYMYQLLRRNAPLVEIPAAHHHLIIDQPLAFIAALRALLADWEHSLPRHLESI
ncbi:MAG TPA: alpha/beta hydrolase [Polyangiaceae bacterium]|nr:alpha/beta hydrolase [Polyangiaceae bacterium]